MLSERKLSVGSRGAESAAQADQARRTDSQAGEGAAQTQGKQRQVEHPQTSIAELSKCKQRAGLSSFQGSIKQFFLTP